VNAFRLGLRARSPIVLAFALALLLPAFALLQAFFTSGAWSDIPLRYWVRDPLDDGTVVSWTVGRRLQDPPKLPTVYLVGGSSAREAIVSGAALAADVRRLGGPRIEAWNMGSIRQTFAQSLAIADTIPADDAWIVIGINVGRFAGDPETTTGQAVGKGLLLKSDYLHRYVADTYGIYRYDPTILPGIFAYLADLGRLYARGLRHGEFAPGRYDLHRVDRKTQFSRARMERTVEAWYRLRYPDFQKYFALNMAVFERLLERCRQRGLHIVLVELPINRDIIGHAFDEPVARYRGPVKKLAAAYGAPYLDFNRELAIPYTQFNDLQHLLAPARPIWQRRLARELVDLMAKAGSGSEAP